MQSIDSAETRVTAADRVYGALASCVFGGMWLAARVFGTNGSELRSRTGVMPVAGQPLVWFHGASAGEMAAAAQLAALLRENGYTFAAAYTATNRAGIEFISRLMQPGDVTALVPWDAPRWVERAFDCWQPRMVVLLETELWPRLILEARCRKVPTFCASARIYQRDFLRYRLARSLMRPALQRLTGVVALNDIERQQFIVLGAPPERCISGGNLKYLRVCATTDDDRSLRSELGLRRTDRVLVAGSVHVDEVPMLFTALDRVAAEAIRFIIAPRHAVAGETILRESTQRGWRVSRRSRGDVGNWRMLVLDTMGELADVYGLAAVAIVGGGFCRHGGHNLFEPVLSGAPVIFGSHVDHFAREAEALTSRVPEAQVTTAEQLHERLTEWLADDSRRDRVLALQQGALPDRSAVSQRYLTALAPWLEERCQ